MKWLLLPVFWAACVAAGYLYTQQKGVPWDIAQVVAPAFVLEATLFLALALEGVRARLEKLPRAAVAGLLVLAAVAPYVVASVALGSFSWTLLGGLAALVGVLAFWYVVLPHNPLADAGLLAFAAAVYLLKVFGEIYVRPHDALKMEALGQAMWIRTGLLAILSVRRVRNIGFGFWPELREWEIGAVWFIGFLPVAAGLGWAIGFTRPEWPTSSEWTLLPLTFFGTLWLLALGEELFFRGLLQQWMSEWLKNEWAGLALTSLLFGAVHVWYREFPNWKLAVLATLAGVFYGFAFRQGKGIRASMVTHALTVTTWKTFFS
ncbi:MAG: CPBP family intramembrane glutamic endopeptidase [Bryobacteraceae bacterium]